jgi:hypothetical protein
MKDIFEAIERLSAQLSYRLEHIAKKAALPAHFSGYSVAPTQGVLVRLFSTMIHLPKGFAVNIMPRAQPEPDGSWQIDIRRNDGVSRSSWSGGLTVRKVGDTFALTYNGRQLAGEDIHKMLADLEKPGLSGMALMISRLWIMMYGRMPEEFATRLEAIRDVDLLDNIHDSLVNDTGADHVRSLIMGKDGGKTGTPHAGAGGDASAAAPVASSPESTNPEQPTSAQAAAPLAAVPPTASESLS